MELSKRLRTVAGLVSEGSRLVDVGTDHGYIPIYLVEKKKILSAIAVDVRKGPLLRAKTHIEQAGLGAYIECRLSDGLRELSPGEGDSLLLAGMGGNLMARILAERPEVRDSFREVILQPQSAQSLVRKTMDESGWQVDGEEMVLEDGKFYPMLRLIPRKQADRICDAGYKNGAEYRNEAEYRYGKLLLRERHPVLKEYLDRQQELSASLMDSLKERRGKEKSESVETRLFELRRERAILQEALAYWK